MLRKKCLCEVDQIWNNAIVGIRPEGCKFKAVACLLLLCLSGICILDGIKSGTGMPATKVRFKGQHLDMNSGFYSRSFTLHFSYCFGGYKKKEIKGIDTSRFRY